MIVAFDTTTIDGRRYVTGYRVTSERGYPSGPDEIAGPIMEGGKIAELTDANGKLRLVLEHDIDGKPKFVERLQSLTVAEIAAKIQTAKRAAIAAALPDILVAVAAGADLRTEIQKVLDAI